MSEVTKLGVLLDATAQRDAVHVAVAPVIAGETLYPGQHVGFASLMDTETVLPIADGPRGFQNRPALGIIDPFLTKRVLKGERCWLFLYPQTITSLRHQWTHPAFDYEVPTETPRLSDKALADVRRAESEQWLRTYASNHDVPDYDIMMGEVDKHVNQHTMLDWVTIHGYSAYGTIPPEFWAHYENVRGIKVDESYRASSFSCSC